MKDEIRLLQQHTNNLAFNYFLLKRRGFYDKIKKRGIKDFFKIKDGKKVYLITNYFDEIITPFYVKNNGLNRFKEDVINFQPDYVMGPDWFLYWSFSPLKRREELVYSQNLNLECIDLKGFIPNLQGLSLSEISFFIEPFIQLGFHDYIVSGRERLINYGERKNTQQQFFSLIHQLSKKNNIDLMVTGCNSLSLMKKMFMVKSCFGFGWAIQAKQRRLIENSKFLSIFNKNFKPCSLNCCINKNIKEIASKENDINRYIHNIRWLIDGASKIEDAGLCQEGLN